MSKLSDPLFWESIKVPDASPPKQNTSLQTGASVAKSAAQSVGRAADSVGAFVKGVATGVWQSSPPGAILHAVSTGEVQPELQAGVKELSALFPPVKGSEYTVEQAFEQGGPIAKGAAAGAVALGEWVGINKAQSAIDFIVKPAVEGLSGSLKDAIVKTGVMARLGMEQIPKGAELATKLNGASTEQIISLGEKAAARKGVADVAKRVTSHAISGGIIGAGLAAGNKALGMQPQWTTNVALGALIGAGAGVYGKETNANIIKNAPELMKNLSATDKETLGHIHDLAMGLEKKGSTHAAAMSHIAKVMNGTAGEGARLLVQQEVTANPHMLRNKSILDLYKRSKILQSPAIHNTPEGSQLKARWTDAKGNTHESNVSEAQLDKLDKSHREGKINLEFASGPNIRDRYSAIKPKTLANAFSLPDEATVNGILKRGETEDFIDGAFGGKKNIIPRTMGEDVTSRATNVNATVPSPANLFDMRGYGTPVAQEMVGDVQPVVRTGGTTHAGKTIAVPGAEAILPAKSSARVAVPSIPELKQPIRVSDSQKNLLDLIKHGDESALLKANPSSLAGLVTKKIIRTEDITNANVAQTLAAHLFDQVNIAKGVVKKAQLSEYAVAMRDHELKLRNEPVQTKTQMNRESESGDIVRVNKHDSHTSQVVDKRGKTAIVKNSVVKPNKVSHVNDIEPITSKSTNAEKAETLKKLETAIGLNDKEPISVKGNKSSRGLKGFSKGAIIFTRSAEVKDGLGEIANKAGLKLFRAQNGGYIIEQGVLKHNFKNPEELADFLARHVTAARVEAEQEAVLDTGKIALPNIEGVGQLSPLVDTYHKMSAALSEAGDKSAVPYVHFTGIAGGLRMQKTELAGMGEGGRKLAAAGDHFSGLWETLSSQDRAQAVNVAHDFKRRGITGDMIEDGRASAADVELYKNAIGIIWDRNYNDAKFFGIEGDYIKPKEHGAHVPHNFDFTPKDISFDTIADFKSMGMIGEKGTAEDAVKVLQDPERYALTSKAMADPQSKAIALENLRKIKAKQAYLAGTLEKSRRGNAGWITDIPTLVDRSINQQARRIAEATVFGPNLERMENYLAEIGNNSAFGSEAHTRAFNIMQDIRGKTFIPTSELGTTLMDLGRGMLGASATRHLWQSGLLAMRMPLKTVHGVFDFALHLGKNEEHAQYVGSAIDQERWELTEGDREAATSINPNVLTRFAKAYGNAGSALLHQTIGTIRKVATYAGEHAFDSYFDKALNGNKNALALLNEGLKVKLNPTQLGSMDRTQLRRVFAKSVADFAGFTFRPQDMPRFARNILGKALLQFRSFSYQASANWFNALTDKNLPKSTRAARALRLFALVPTIGMLDPVIRHRIGRDTIDSEEARQSFDRMWANPTTRNVITTEVEAMINQHMLGFASDLIQGGLTGRTEISAKALLFNPPSAQIPMALYNAGSSAAVAYMSGDEKYGQQAIKQLSNLGGVGGTKEEALALGGYAIGGETGASLAQAISLYKQKPREKKLPLPKYNLLAGTRND